MTFEDTPALDPKPAKRKPRIALMGEFSAGKSTLSNLMIGTDVIPMQVTATQLPPVWMSYGNDAPYREDLQGNQHPIDLEHLDDIPVSETTFVRLFAEVDLLEICDLIDTPGISDPNMPADVWRRAADESDGVIWLTHATQAWRQSEAAVWSSLPAHLYPSSLLLVTRMDKILTDRDRERLLRRIERETEGYFRQVLPISLTEAMASENDRELWEASGAETFTQALLSLILEIEERKPLRRTPPVAAAAIDPEPVLVTPEVVDDPGAAQVPLSEAIDGAARDEAQTHAADTGDEPEPAEQQEEAPVSLRVENPELSPLKSFSEDEALADESLAAASGDVTAEAFEADAEWETEEAEALAPATTSLAREDVQLGAAPPRPPKAIGGVMPRRVVPKSTAGRERPSRARPVA